MSFRSAHNRDQAAVFNLPVLPTVLLEYSKTLGVYGFENSLLSPVRKKPAEIIMMDPALCLRALAFVADSQTTGQKTESFFQEEVLNEAADLIWLQAVISTEPVIENKDILAFLTHHWQQSLKASFMMKSLAEKLPYDNIHLAQLCGLMMFAGKALLTPLNKGAGQNGLHKQPVSKSAIEHETELSTVRHNQLMASILEKIGISPMVTDAIAYQHEDIQALTSAPVLSRMQWACEELSGNQPESRAVSAAAGLLGMEINELMSVREQAELKTVRLAEEWHIDMESRGSEITAADLERSHCVKTRFHAMALSVLLKEKAGIAGDKLPQKQRHISPLVKFLEQGLMMTLGCRFFLLLNYKRDTETLSCAASNLDPELVSGMAIPCSPDSGDGFLATRCFLHSGPFSVSEQALKTVLDKQLLKGMDTEFINAFPLIVGEKQVGVLLAGSWHELRLDDARKVFLSSVLTGIAGKLLTESIQPEQAESASEDSDARNECSFMDQLTFRNMVHEVNNPLTIIKNYLQLLGMKLKDREEIREDLKVIDSEISRINTILMGYRDGAGSSSGRNTVKLNEQVEGITRVVAASLSESSGITIITDLQPDLSDIDCEADKIRQAVTNLVKNAVEALVHGGEIIVSTSLEIDMSGTEYQKLTVTDSGPGLDPDVRKHLFQHGHSTKGEGNTGSGLAITKNLVEEMNGTINCQSSGKGTIFSLLLPVN